MPRAKAEEWWNSASNPEWMFFGQNPTGFITSAYIRLLVLSCSGSAMLTWSPCSALLQCCRDVPGQEVKEIGGSHVENARPMELLAGNAEGKVTRSKTMSEGLQIILGE